MGKENTIHSKKGKEELIKRKVIEVISGDTFLVDRSIDYESRSFTTIKATGYNAPQEGEQEFEKAKEKLKQIILNEQIELTVLGLINRDPLECMVNHNKINIASSFLEYQHIRS
jgi:endonuclease YncB( thermonuclease family)